MSRYLSDFHKVQLAKYEKFFKQKREVQVQEIQEIFNDVQEARLDGDSLLDPDEVKDILQTLCQSIRTSYEDDLRRTVSMSMLAIQQLFQDADAQDLELEMDTSKIEDTHLIAEMEKIRLDGPSASSHKTKANRLVSLRDEQQRIVDQNMQLQGQINTVNREKESIQDELDRARQLLSNHTYEIEALKLQLETAKRQSTGTSSAEESKGEDDSSKLLALQQDLDHERGVAVDLRAELADARQLLLETRDIDLDYVTERFRSSKQFQQMRKTLQQKTDQLTDLRRRLVQYEPDGTNIVRDFHEDTPLRHK